MRNAIINLDFIIENLRSAFNCIYCFIYSVLPSQTHLGHSSGDSGKTSLHGAPHLTGSQIFFTSIGFSEKKI